MLWDWRFLRLLLAMGRHKMNNSPFQPPYNLKFLAIGFVAWVALLAFIQEGLKEVRMTQVERITDAHTQVS